MTDCCSTEGQMLLTSAQIISSYCLPPYCGELPHVTQCIDAFLDVFSTSWNFAETFSKTHSLHLMQYVASKDSAVRPMDSFFRRYLFNRTTWLAAERGDLNAVQWLVGTYLPNEFLTKAVNGAAAGGHVDILQWLFDNCSARTSWGGIELCRALTNKHFETIEWLRRNAPPKPESLRKIMQAAGQAGDSDVIWWLYTEHYIDAEEALWSAQMESNWDTAKWILENCEMSNPTISWSCAARCGELKFLKFAYSLGIGSPNKDAMHAAAAGGHLDVIEWLHLVVLLPLRSEAARNAAENGHLDVVQWFKKNGCQGWEVGIMNAAATGGHLDVLAWLHENSNDQCNASAMHIAARNGSLDAVKWLISKNYDWEVSNFTMHNAVRSGNLELVKWLYSNSSERFLTAMDGAARSGHLEIIKWLHYKRVGGCTTQAMDWAAANGHLEVVTWLHTTRTEGGSTRAMDKAATNGHLAVVQWLHYNRSEGCTTAAMTNAIKNSHFDVVLFLNEHRSEGFDSEAITLEKPCLELTQWIITNYPDQVDGWVFILPPWDWHCSEWCHQVNLLQDPTSTTKWVCDSTVLRRNSVSYALEVRSPPVVS